jgi:hypothetical protein
LLHSKQSLLRWWTYFQSWKNSNYFWQLL